ncbi:TPR-like protein [Rhizoctonia solani]|uniref:TPR-like protein n=1 Tax=Rhizoctonia solani TaxID=456999 RepID=A0A8H7I9J6_9AGAM|nr:TPR-like protein [Rhizoctonia solani]
MPYLPTLPLLPPFLVWLKLHKLSTSHSRRRPSPTPGLTPLPGTTTELGYLQVHSKQRTDYSQLTDERATRKAVLDAMDDYDWVHLACHASQDLRDSTKSRFYLHDGTLDLSAINERTFRSKGLAYLSACQTATGDEKLPDEAIHLASGMLMAGYRSVIASLWSVVDEDAPFVADKVYGRLLEDGKVGNGEAGRALHDAVAGLREKVGEKEFGRWCHIYTLVLDVGSGD